MRFVWTFVSGQLFGHVVPFHFWKATGDLAHVAIFLRFFFLSMHNADSCVFCFSKRPAASRIIILTRLS